MTERNVDDLIREWTDIGEEHLPDRYLQAALAEIETTPQRGAWPAPLKGLIMRFQTTAPYLAVAAVIVAAVVLYAALAGPPVGDQDASPTPSSATPETSATLGPSPTAQAVVSQGTFELTTPAGSAPSNGWVFDTRDDRLAEGLQGYEFFNGRDNGYSVTIYLDPEADYAGSSDTTREDLVVVVRYARNAPQAGTFAGLFETVSGECQITFDRFTASAATGSLECSDVPGRYAGPGEASKDGVAQVSGTFAFDPNAEPSN